MSGWALLVPFILLGILLRARWLGVISVVVLAISALVLLSPEVRNAGPGTYLGWAALGMFALSAFALLVMWVSAGSAWLVRKIVPHKS